MKLMHQNKRFAPTPIIISGDKSVESEIKGTADGRVETHFSERIVLIANHLVSSSQIVLTDLDILGLALSLVHLISQGY